MDLTTVSTGVHKRKLKRRVGRGIGSGQGKTAGRGHKGQYSSAGAGLPASTFTGGQTPIHRRVPKRGFSNARFANEYAIVNIGDLNQFTDGDTVDLAALKSRRLVNGSWDGLRVLGDGDLERKLTVKADHFTAAAKAKIEGRGGSCVLLPKPKLPVRNKMGQGKNSPKKKTAP